MTSDFQGAVTGPSRGRLENASSVGKPTPSPWVVTGLVSIGAFLGQFDATVVQLALPTLGKTFNASLETVSWVALAYLVSFASFLPIFGRLCDMFGRRSLYLTGYLAFISASTLCGVAPDIFWLILFRVLQGIGGALLGANSIAILMGGVGKDRQGRALGFFAAAQAVGMSAGPAVGGLLLAELGWRWLFWVCAPFGAIAAAIGWLFLPRGETGKGSTAFDWRGAILIGPAIVLLVLALNQLSAWGITSVAILAPLGASVALFALLVRQERAVSAPLVDLRLFEARAFSFGAGAVLLGYALLYGMFFLMSFALEHGYGDSPQAAGLRLALIPVALGGAAPFAGALSDRFGARTLSGVGMTLCFAALVILGTAIAFQTASRVPDAAAFILFGAGLGIFIAPNNHATIKAAPPSLAGQAGSMLNLMRVLGTSLGVASATSTLSWGLHIVTGDARDWIPSAGHSTLDAVEIGLGMLACMSVIAGFLSVFRSQTDGEDEPGA